MDNSNLSDTLTQALLYISRKSNCSTFHKMTDDNFCLKHVAPVSTLDQTKTLGLYSEVFRNILPESSSHLSHRQNQVLLETDVVT